MNPLRPLVPECASVSAPLRLQRCTGVEQSRSCFPWLSFESSTPRLQPWSLCPQCCAPSCGQRCLSTQASQMHHCLLFSPPTSSALLQSLGMGTLAGEHVVPFQASTVLLLRLIFISLLLLLKYVKVCVIYLFQNPSINPQLFPLLLCSRGT